MRKITTLAASLCLATPAYAADVWKFTVTSDQNGPDWNCDEPASIPCAITNRAAPYVLGTLTISAPLTAYITNDTPPITAVIDDHHLISFASPTIPALAWPSADTSLIVSINVNEVAGKLSGGISLDIDARGTSTLVMTGMGNTWTGYWYTYGYPIHQFTAHSSLTH